MKGSQSSGLVVFFWLGFEANEASNFSRSFCSLPEPCGQKTLDPLSAKDGFWSIVSGEPLLAVSVAGSVVMWLRLQLHVWVQDVMYAG
jgi:hypothetical protein